MCVVCMCGAWCAVCIYGVVSMCGICNVVGIDVIYVYIWCVCVAYVWNGMGGYVVYVWCGMYVVYVCVVCLWSVCMCGLFV